VTDLEDLARDWSPLICRLTVQDSSALHGSGTGFMTAHGLITASHVANVPPGLRFVIQRGGLQIEIPTQDVKARITHESVEQKHDYAVISMNGIDPRIAASDVTVGAPTTPPVGRHVAYLGYPFGSSSLVVSSGYVSSVEQQGPVTVLRIDGSVNRGNSGGPVVDLQTGELIALVTRAETGFIVEQMTGLQDALRQNIDFLENMPSIMQIGGIDPMKVSQAAMVALLEVSGHIERSANVGIGYAFATGELARTLAL
jgi:hypothetical protein